MSVVFHQYPNHLSGWHYIAVVVFYGLELTYVTDATYGRPTYSSQERGNLAISTNVGLSSPIKILYNFKGFFKLVCLIQI
jgi:hypothetical protein